MIRSLSLRRRCAAASSRGSAAAPAAALEAPVDLAAPRVPALERLDDDRLEDDRPAVLLRAELAEDRLLEPLFAPELERERLEPPLLACGIASPSGCGLRARPTLPIC